jgi:hypothetical protein
MADFLRQSRFIPENPLGLFEDVPMVPSSDYRAMEPFWYMVEQILEGTMAVRAAGQVFLPKYPNESYLDYEARRVNSKFTNIYRDIVETLAAKPFSKEIRIVDGTSTASIDELVEDIDGQGNHLHVFAAQVFFQSVNDGVDWIFIDKQQVPENSTIAVEKQLGVRPYWVHIPAKRLLAVYSDVIDGHETIIHARIWEPTVQRVGYKEVQFNRVRELNRAKNADGSYGPATFIVWEERKEPNTQVTYWVNISQGPIAIGEIALVPVITGRRKGNAWQFVPPMQDAAFLQIEHYQQETNLKVIKEQAAFPMLAGNGVTPPTDAAGQPVPINIGPKTVLFAPPGADATRYVGRWEFVEPSSTSMKFLADDVQATEQQLRELGRQPLTAQTGNLTVVTTAFAAQKGNSAIQAWALNLKDALEQAMLYTVQWLGETAQPEIQVHTDFAIDLESPEAPTFLQFLRTNGDISRAAVLAEAQRRDYLSPEFDPDDDQKELDKEEPAAPTPQDIADALPPNPNNPNPPPPPRLNLVKS